MDPLSMTASIIAVLQLTTTLTSYINDLRHASTEQADLAVEASSLSTLLLSLRSRVEAARSDDAWFKQVKSLGIRGGPLDQFKDTLERMVGQMVSSRKRDQIKSALTWKFTKPEVENALQRIERLKSLINCALIGDLLTLSQGIHSDVLALSEQTERLQRHADQELQRNLSRWLELPDPSTNFHAALEKRHPETGLWLVNGQQFDRWKSSASSFMWLHGNAGCGKTVLSAVSLQHLIQLKQVRPDTLVAYFYFDLNDLTLQQNNRLQTLEQLYQRCGSGQQQPAEDLIRSMLKDAIVCTGDKYIVMDALDECTDREDLTPFIREVVDSQHEGLRIMITSRREKDIEDSLGPIAGGNINIQSAIVDEDIKVYVRDRLASDSKLKKWPEKVQEEIIAVLMEKADGMFRWVYCQLESIRKCVKLSALKKVLSTLPKTLYETYDRILQNLESAGQLQDATTVLRWLCFSKAPLHLSEIIEVLAIENGDDGGFRPDERLPDPADIMVICSSLISCSDLDKGIRTARIRLAHFSVKEYLLSDQCPLTLDFQKPACHMAMTEGCLYYLLYLYENLALTETFVDQHPLCRHAAEYWWRYAQAIDYTANPRVRSLALKMLTNKDAGVHPWIQLFPIESSRVKWIDLSITIRDVAQPLYYIAMMPGHESMVQLLLDAGGDANAEGGRFHNVLHVASAAGHEKVVQLLVHAGADVNAKGGFYGTALQAASRRGYEPNYAKVVQILLDAGADINMKGGDCGSALQAASAHGIVKMVQMLLDAGADANIEAGNIFPGRFCGTAVREVLVAGYEEIMRMLLDAGADVNADAGEFHGNALKGAAANGREEVVQMLLDAGADVDAEGTTPGTALQVASSEGHEKVVQILLDAGADVHNPFALQAASANGHEKTV